jgi:hypothetical protein
VKDSIQVTSGIGHNNPPEPTPFERVSTRISDLMGEARNWLDGAGVNSQAEADAIAKLLNDIRLASKEAEEARKAEAKPFDDGKAAVQARYKPLLSSADTAADTCKLALKPYLEKVEAEKRAAAEAARKEAEEKAEAARKAMAEANRLDVAARQRAEELAAEAKAAERAASKAENDKASGKGGARAVTLRSVWRAVLMDRKEAARHFWTHYPEGFDATLSDMAAQAIRSGARAIPGFDVIEEKVAQ